MMVCPGSHVDDTVIHSCGRFEEDTVWHSKQERQQQDMTGQQGQSQDQPKARSAGNGALAAGSRKWVADVEKDEQVSCSMKRSQTTFLRVIFHLCDVAIAP
jgi:hypothetical protein